MEFKKNKTFSSIPLTFIFGWDYSNQFGLHFVLSIGHSNMFSNRSVCFLCVQLYNKAIVFFHTIRILPRPGDDHITWKEFNLSTSYFFKFNWNFFVFFLLFEHLTAVGRLGSKNEICISAIVCIFVRPCVLIFAVGALGFQNCAVRKGVFAWV